MSCRERLLGCPEDLKTCCVDDEVLSGLPDGYFIPKASECSLQFSRKGLLWSVLLIWILLSVQERLFAWLGGLRASDICGGLLAKLSEHGMANGQRMKLEALRVCPVIVSSFLSLCPDSTPAVGQQPQRLAHILDWQGAAHVAVRCGTQARTCFFDVTYVQLSPLSSAPCLNFLCAGRRSRCCSRRTR